VLAQEKDPCIFAYAQRFKVPGTEIVKERRGFIALGKLHDYAEQVVFRHEQTLSKPKSDRLNLLKATHAHFGQIFMLYSDPAGSVEKILYDGAGPAEAEVTDEYGVLHRLWKSATRRPSPANHGHGRQEADYRRRPPPLRDGAELLQGARGRRAGQNGVQHQPVAQPAFPEAAVMMTFVNMDSDGLVILPTHRVVHSLKNFDPAAFARAAEEFFTVEPLPAAAASSFIDTLGRQQGTAFVAVTRAGALLLRAKPEPVAAALASLPERQRQLDLSCLHSIVLDRLLGLDAEKVREQTNMRYLRDAAEAVEQVRRGEADVTFLTNPVSMEQLREVAFAGDVMPQKSTDFFPKLLSGLTIYALD
jgi:uncharacterized protein (DUF1015 family)